MAAEQLVMKIKEMQRSDPVAKEQWYAYCEHYGEDVRDPAKHNAGYLNGFLAQYNNGTRLEFAGGQQLARFIKQGQKKSTAWKGVWDQYCAVSDNSREHDPAKREYAFLEGFFDFIGKKSQGGGMMMGMAMPNMAVAGAPAAKRMRGAAPMAMGGAIDLVARVKAYQKESEQQKNNWHTYCDMHLGGVRDPSRHDAATLQQFLASSGGGGGAYVMPPQRAPMMGGGESPLVLKVKSYQRQGAAEKDNWHHFSDSNCGGVRDPARLEVHHLQNFIATYGL